MKKRILTLAIAILTLSLLVCASVVAASASEETPAVSIDRFNLTFESDTYIKYAVKFDGIDDESITRANTGMLYWTAPQTSYTIGSESSSSEIIGYTTIEGEKYYTFSYDKFAAKQMTEYIYSVAYVIVDGEYYYSAPVKYSILTYAYDKLGYTGTATESETLAEMLVDLLAYGASAQKHFGYRTDRLADSQYYQVTVEGGRLEDGFTTGLYNAGETATLTSPATSGDLPFAGWQNSAEAMVSTDNPLALTEFSQNETYTATYAPAVKYSEGLKFTSNGDGTCYVSGIGTCTDADVIIPPVSPAGDKVTGIGNSAFKDCTTIESVEIPASVTIINEKAFDECKNLANVTFSEDSKLEIIGDSAFAFTNFTRINLPDSLTTIGYAAFYYGAIRSITIPGGVTIGDSAFEYCSILGEVTIVDGVTTIGDNAFSECVNLRKITIPNTVTKIGHSAFYKCGSGFYYAPRISVYYTGTLEEWCNITFVTGTSSPTNCEGNLYINGELVTDLVIPDTVTEIKPNAFAYCLSLTSVTIPDSVTSIGVYAFNGCSNLTSVTIGDGVTNIFYGSFINCERLKNVYYNGTVAEWCNISFGSHGANPVLNGANLYIDGELVTDLVIPDTVTEIKSCAFEGCLSLTSVTIPASVISIGSRAFLNCTSLTSIVIPDSVTSIGNYAFENCSSLTSVVIPNGVKSIGYAAFSGCSSLTSIEIPDSVTSIGDYAFDDCTNLTIYCEAASQPSGWGSDWNPGKRPVVWGYKG